MANMQDPVSQQPLLPAAEQYSPMDKLIDKAGSHGRYQWISFVIAGMHWVMLGWLLMGVSFYYETEPFQCDGKNTQECQQYVCSLPQSKWPDYLQHPPNTIAYQWDWLVCGNEYIVSVLQALAAVGGFTGLIVFSHIADNFGRRMALYISWISFTVGLAVISFSNGTMMVGVGNVLMGFGLNSCIILDFVFINEQSTGRARQYYSVGIQLFLAVSESIVGYAMFWMENWRLSFYISLGVSLAVCVAHLFIMETPKYLVGKDINKTVEVMNKIAKINGGQTITYDEVLQAYEKEEVTNSDSNFLVLFRFASLRSKTLCAGCLFFALQVIYTCSILSVGAVGFESRQNQLAMGISEGTSYLVAQMAIPFIPRRVFTMATIGLSGTLSLSLALLTMLTKDLNALELTIFFAMRFVICMLYAVLFVYVAELYPTKVRGLGLGFANIAGTLGTFISPFIILISSMNDLNEWILPGAFGVLATLAAIPLVETRGIVMQEEGYERKKSTIMKNTLKSGLTQ